MTRRTEPEAVGLDQPKPWIVGELLHVMDFMRRLDEAVSTERMPRYEPPSEPIPVGIISTFAT